MLSIPTLGDTTAKDGAPDAQSSILGSSHRYG